MSAPVALGWFFIKFHPYYFFKFHNLFAQLSPSLLMIILLKSNSREFARKKCKTWLIFDCVPKRISFVPKNNPAPQEETVEEGEV